MTSHQVSLAGRLRLVLLGGLLVWLAPAARAQVNNPGFDYINPSCTPAQFGTAGTGPSTTPFRFGCVPAWTSSHGTPQIRSTARGVPGVDQIAYMWSEWTPGNIPPRSDGEGIFTTLNLVPGNTYTLVFNARFVPPSSGTPPTTSNIMVQLANNLVPGPLYNPAFPSNTSVSGFGSPIPSGITTSLIAQQALTSTMTEYSVTFAAPFGSVFQLWFYPPPPTSPDNRYDLELNGVEVYGCFNSSPIYYQNTSTLPDFTQGGSHIFAGRAVTTGTQGPVTVLSGQHVEFGARSGYSVQLLDGFSAEAGSDFRAYTVESCVYTRPAPPSPGTLPINSTNANKTAQISLQLFPNPAGNDLTLALYGIEQPDRVTWRILDAYGIEKLAGPLRMPSSSYTKEGVGSSELTINSMTLDITRLPPGLYQVVVVSGQKHQTARFEKSTDAK